MATPLVHVVFCLDCSASMSSFREETELAFNAFVSTLQKTKGAEVKLTLIEYRDKATVIYKAKPIQDVAFLDNDYRPNSGKDTLFDVVHFAVHLAEREKSTSKIVVCILCDGGDTSSSRTGKEAKALIAKKRAEGWEFCYLAAGMMAYVGGYPVSGGSAAVAEKILGLPEESIIQYGQDYRGDGGKAVKAFGASAWNIGAFGAGRAEHVTYTKEQKQAAGG